MALNLARKPSRYVRVTKASVSSGDAIEVNGLAGIAMTDTDADGMVEIDIGHEVSVYNLEVVAEDESGASAVAIGDPLYIDSGEVNKDGVNGVFIGRALASVSSGQIATIAVMLGALSSGVPLASRIVKTLTESFVIGDFTDNTNATGFVDFDGELPIGALVLGWSMNVTTGFTGDTTAVAQLGVSGDVDRFSADTTQSCLTTGRRGSSALAADAAKGMSAAVTPRFTVTGGSDFGNIAAGAVTVSVLYVETA